MQMRLNELMNMRMQAGLVLENGESLSFEVEVGDVLFFPMGSQHYLKSGCPDGILLVLGYSTGNMELQTQRLNRYFRSLPAAILARLFSTDLEKTRMLLRDQLKLIN